MRIQKNDVIAGQPAFAVRKLLKQEQGAITTIARILDIDLPDAQQVFHILCTEGYIQPSEAHYDTDKDDPRWENTIKGNALVNATARKAVTRQTAERLLQEFLQRVEKVNSSDDYAYYIKQVIIFGSYLSGSPTLGDIDLSLVLELRDDDLQERHKHFDERIKLAQKQGRHFKSDLDSAFWPYQEVIQFLENRSSPLSLHDEQHEQVLSRGIPSKIIFDASNTKD